MRVSWVLAAVSASVGLAGCGALAGDNIRGKTWRVEMVAGAGTIDTGQTSFEISDAGRLATTIGCNRIGGPAKIDGANITLGPLMATRMACAPALMDQEARYTAALEAARSYVIENGMLKLKNEAGDVVVTFAGAG